MILADQTKVGEMAIKERAGRLSAEQTLELWRAYRQTGDPRLRDRLVLTLAPMVKYIAYRKIREMPPQCEVDDFISCGLEALIRAIDRYDPDKGATLEQSLIARCGLCGSPAMYRCGAQRSACDVPPCTHCLAARAQPQALFTA